MFTKVNKIALQRQTQATPIKTAKVFEPAASRHCSASTSSHLHRPVLTKHQWTSFLGGACAEPSTTASVSLCGQIGWTSVITMHHRPALALAVGIICRSSALAIGQRLAIDGGYRWYLRQRLIQLPLSASASGHRCWLALLEKFMRPMHQPAQTSTAASVTGPMLATSVLDKRPRQ